MLQFKSKDSRRAWNEVDAMFIRVSRHLFPKNCSNPISDEGETIVEITEDIHGEARINERGRRFPAGVPL